MRRSEAFAGVSPDAAAVAVCFAGDASSANALPLGRSSPAVEVPAVAGNAAAAGTLHGVQAPRCGMGGDVQVGGSPSA